MLNVICIISSVISVCCCLVCIFNFKNTNDDREYYLKQYLTVLKEKNEVLEHWDKTIKLCEELIAKNNMLIKYNESLADINADIRLELIKIKENINA